MRLAVVFALLSCSPLSPLRADAGFDAGATAGGSSGGSAGGGSAFAGGFVITAGGSAVVAGGRAGWPVTEVDAGTRFIVLPKPSTGKHQLIVAGGTLFAANELGATWKRDGAGWQAVHAEGSPLIRLAPIANGFVAFDLVEVNFCTGACLDGGAGVRRRVDRNPGIVCRGEPLRYMSDLGGLYELRDGGFTYLTGGITNIDVLFGGCATVPSGRFYMGGGRILTLGTDGGLRTERMTESNTSISSFWQTPFGLVAQGASQQLLIEDAGVWPVVTERAGLFNDPWVDSVLRADGTLVIIGYEALSFATAGRVRSERWPWGSLRTDEGLVVADDAGVIWLSGRWSSGSNDVTQIVGIEP